jgi:hypothetical protein
MDLSSGPHLAIGLVELVFHTSPQGPSKAHSSVLLVHIKNNANLEANCFFGLKLGLEQIIVSLMDACASLMTLYPAAHPECLRI